MYYLNKVHEAIFNYIDVYESRIEDLPKIKKDLESKWGNGSIYEEKYLEVKATLDNNVNVARANAVKIINEEFNNILTIVKNFMMNPVPDDFNGTIEALKHFDTIGEKEASVYLEKYKHNYLAYKAIASIFNKISNKNHYVVGFEKVLNYIESYKDELKSFTINSPNFTSYTRALYKSDKHTPLNNFDKELYNFTHEDVGVFMNEDER